MLYSLSLFIAGVAESNALITSLFTAGVAESGALSLPILLSVMSLQIHTRRKIKGKRKITANF
jgi:hypothetical protein